MKNNFKLFLLIAFISFFEIAFSQRIAERLGYPKDAKLLIIHADDLGVSHSENMASIKAMEEGSVNSASIMVPCPWFPEIANYAKHHTDMDFGLHLTLTSEWKYYKWGPSYKSDSMASYINEQGYFYDNVSEVVSKANPDFLKAELSTQIRTALNAGIDVTHLDAHMGAVMATEGFFETYIEVGHEFKVPVLLSKGMPALKSSKIRAMLTDKNVILDAIISASPNDFEEGMEGYYSTTINELEPGITCLLIHTAYDNQEMQGVTIDHPNWGAAWRQADFDFFTSKKCADLLKENEIVLITWREIRDKITRSQD
ncbi:polysaccharide deacetylase family protein [Croceitalea vernalis]|uniref:Polysaccharide deacetylase family protein n=1 Tax=Croceitalea vernalis TaxID=3075599 RepID=A0ABU3BH77_9FLAO|nr:polysaccharide deacetylase family protein [Croceitalea sp. P007]MDT0621507.1 polysaccharide deacetylase family protein [Croceitalea sp. P007]